MSRDPFAFLKEYTPEGRLLIILQALLRRSGGEAKLTLQELTQIEPGDSLMKYPSDKGDTLIVRFARRGAEAYFLPEVEASKPEKARMRQPETTERPRHAAPSDLDLAMMEEERAQQMRERELDRERKSRVQAGIYPFQTKTQ